MNGVKAVLLPETLRIVKRCCCLPRTGNYKLYVNTFVNQLQAVPVAGNNYALPVIGAANSADGSHHIVCFPTLALVNRDVHRRKHLLHNGHLLSKLFRHFMAGCLVAIIHLMAKCGSVKVEGNANCVRLFFLFYFLKDVQKAVNGIGKQSISGGKRSYAIKSAVNNAVTIQNQ